MIKTRQMLKNMMDLNKESFLGMYNTISYLQKQTENISNSIIDQNVWLPDKSKNQMKEWSKIYKKEINRFKKNVETGYEKIEELIVSQ